jgi:hypothetical protein
MVSCDPHSHGIAGEVAPKEPEAKDQPTKVCLANRVDPAGVI